MEAENCLHQDSWHPPQKCQPQIMEEKILRSVSKFPIVSGTEEPYLVSQRNTLFHAGCPFLKVGVKVLFGRQQRKITL